MTDAYFILQNTDLLAPIHETYFNQLVKDFQASFLDTKNLYQRIEKHRHPEQVKNEVLDELYKYLQAIQYRPEMQDVGADKKHGGSVPTQINEIWRSDKTLRSLYSTVKVYVALRGKNFNTIAVHVAEYRAMNKLIPIVKRSINKNKVVATAPATNYKEKIVTVRVPMAKLAFHQDIMNR